jgi:diguanylate cyclase (GGDEF)-like protein
MQQEVESNQHDKRIQALEAILQQPASRRDEISTLAELAWQLRFSKTKKAKTLAKKAIKLAQGEYFAKKPYNEGLAAGLVALASIESQNGQIESGVKNCLEAISLLENFPSSKTNARVWQTLSWNSFFLGDYTSAQHQALKSLDLSSRLNLKIEKAWALDTVASAYGISKDFQNALQAHREAIHIFQDDNDVDGIIRATNNMAMTLHMMEDYQTALAWAKQNLQIIRKWERKHEELNAACTIAQILIGLKRLDDAENYLGVALTASKVLDNTDIFHVIIFMELARLSQMRGDLKNAKINLFEALKIAKRTKQKMDVGKCHQNLAEIFEQEGDYKHSLEHMKEFLSIHEDAVGERAAIRMSILSFTHQIETSRQEAEIYRLKAEQLHSEVEKQKRTSELLETVSKTDSLTGIANRRHFDERLSQEYSRHSRTGNQLSLIMLDIDHFKLFNDTYGHIKGDACLKRVAQAIQTRVNRSTDMVARYGGEEFACILPDTNNHAAIMIAERIRQAILGLGIPHTTSPVADRVTASLGVVTATCHQSVEPSKLIEFADQQLYSAKESGRNKIESGIL